MSIEKEYIEYDGYIPTCDYCGCTLPCEYSFDDAVAVMRSAGWKSINVDGYWENACPECYKRINGAAADFAGVGR